MKKLFLLLALVGLFATGCTEGLLDDLKNLIEKPEGGNNNEGGNEDNIPENIFFALDKESATFSPDGGSVDVIVYSNYAWELTNNCDWITTSITSGDASDTGVTVTLTADLTYDDREGTIVFSCGKAKKLLVVSQKFKEAIIPDANNTFNIPAEGGVAILNYQTTVDCEVIIPEEAQDWITIAPATRGLVSENITLNIAENTTYSARTAVIKVVAKDNAELVVEYTINQEQNDADAILADGNNTFNVSGAGGSVVIKYQANVDCDVIIPDEAQDWVTIAPATRGLSTYSTTLNIAENNAGKRRSCVVKVVSKDNNKLSAEYTIIQNSSYCLYYTSSNGEVVKPYNSSVFGATIISNTYIDGVGVIEFDTPITTIGEWAFCERSSLTSVTIPDSVTTIGEHAFALCSSLTSVTIPDSVTEIGDYAFSSCYSLTSVTIPDSVTTIGYMAFDGCGLTSVTIPDSVTTIGDWAFCRCDSLTSVTIPDSVTTIGDNVFDWCTSLTSVTIPDSVTEIGYEAFGYCRSLTSVTIPDSVTSIGDRAFYDCRSLTSVTIPESVTTIGDSAFSYCTGELIINSKIVETDYTDNNYPSYYGWLKDAKFTKLTIGDSVTSIGDCAFYWCYSLTSVTIPDSVTTIGYAAFYYCSSLTSVTIGDGVTTIEYAAFYDCSSLTSVYCKATTPPAGGSKKFYNNALGRKIYVPMESVEAYKNAYRWSEYADDIVGYDF